MDFTRVIKSEEDCKYFIQHIPPYVVEFNLDYLRALIDCVIYQSLKVQLVVSLLDLVKQQGEINQEARDSVVAKFGFKYDRMMV